MHFFKSILPLVLVAVPVLAAPAPAAEGVDDVKHSSSLETRAVSFSYFIQLTKYPS